MARRSRRPLPTGLLAVGIGLALVLGPALAPATIEEQRQRLPPPAFDCDDAITGVWQSHSYYEHVGQWYMFRLEIAREQDGGEALTGTINAEFWDGDHQRSSPPACSEPGSRALVFEHAKGRAQGLQLSFSATDWRDEGVCGTHIGGYLLDNFSGTVDPELMEFQSVLNADAPEWRDVPTVFRRVQCAPPSLTREDQGPRVTIAPPAYEPPERQGCGLSRP